MEENDPNKKVLLMGKNGAGKTSMRSIIFANFLPKDTMRLGFTHSINESRMRFLGNLCLSLWDCGGQDHFMQHYFESQRDTLFRNVQVLIYVFDIKSDDQRDMKYYKNCVEAIKEHSPTARIFVLIHKLDLIQQEKRAEAYSRREKEIIQNSDSLKVVCFGTSIWDETLYLAWSKIVNYMIPNSEILSQSLKKFCLACEADEVVLFEKSTFLVISSFSAKDHRDSHRFEKVSNIIKLFKLSCSKATARFKSMTVMNSNFCAFIDEFTSSTYIMLVSSDSTVQPALTQININIAKKHFEDIVKSSTVMS
jgi:Ras-related GTP-binding protein A/B